MNFKHLTEIHKLHVYTKSFRTLSCLFFSQNSDIKNSINDVLTFLLFIIFHVPQEEKNKHSVEVYCSKYL